MRRCSASAIAIPPRRSVSPGSNATTLGSLGGVPARTTSLGVPPQVRTIRSVSRLSPSSRNAGSTPRSNRVRASLAMPSLRPVAPIRSGEK